MTKEQIKALVERYPYLAPRDPWTGEIPKDYDYSRIFSLELPEGWIKLFFQLCEDIRQPLIDSGYINAFRFLQVKEKYNTLRCYHCGAPEEVSRIIDKYEQMAYYICTHCGKPAMYETCGYLASYCEDCWKDFARHDAVNLIEFSDSYKVQKYSKGETTIIEYSFKDEWNRYINSLEK